MTILDMQEQINRAGHVTRDIGEALIQAAEREDIEILRALRDALKDVVDILNTVMVITKMAESQ